MDSGPSTFSQRYKQLSIDLYSSPCYAVISHGPLPSSFQYGDFSVAHDRRHRGQDEPYDWKPVFSGRLFRHMLWVSLWLAVLAHFVLSRFVGIHDSRLLGTIAPAAFASLLVKFTAEVVAAEVRRESYQINSVPKIKKHHRTLLRLHRRLVIFIMAPLMCAPLSKTYHPSSQWLYEWGIQWQVDRVQLLTFSSWTKALENHGAVLPVIESVAPLENQDQPMPKASESWRINSDTTELGFLRMPGVLNLTGSVESGNLDGWGRSVSGEGVVMPIGSENFLKLTTFSASMDGSLGKDPNFNEVYLDYLSLGWECTILPLRLSWNLSEAHHLQSGPCAAVVTLSTYSIDTAMLLELEKTHLDEIEKTLRTLRVTTDLETRRRLQARFDRLHQDMQLLNEEVSLVALRPQLVKGKGATADAECDRTFFFVGANRPFVTPHTAIIPRESLSIAVCQPHYASTNVTFTLQMQSGSSISRRGGFSSISKLPRWQHLLPTVIQPKQQPAWKPLEEEATMLIDRILTDRVLPAFANHQWARLLLRYDYFDAVTGRTFGIASLALASKLVWSQAAEKVSQSAALTFSKSLAEMATSESVPKGIRSIKGKLSTQHFDPQVSSIWLQPLLVVFCVICTAIIYQVHTVSNGDKSGLPWSISSITAKCALFVRSRIPLAFASNGPGPQAIYAVPGLRLGSWTHREGHSSYSWYLDTMCNKVVFDKSASAGRVSESPKLWQRRSRRSLKAVLNPLNVLGVIVLLLLLGKFVYSWADVPLSFSSDRFSQPFTTVHVLGITLEPGILQNIIFMILPPLLALAVFGWWDDLDRSYTARQPWAGLARPNSAALNLTLDYVDCQFRFWKAWSNRHWLIVLFSIGSVFTLVLPIVAATLLRLDSHAELQQVFKLQQYKTWDAGQLASLAAAADRRLPVSAIDALINPSKDLQWIFEQSSIMPVELDTADTNRSSRPGTFWQVGTSSIRSQLVCKKTRVSFRTRKKVSHELEPSVYETMLELRLPRDLKLQDGTHSIFIEPCRRGSKEDNTTSKDNEHVVCSRWVLDSVYDEASPDPLPKWFVAIIAGQEHKTRWPSDRPKRSGPTGVGLICEPDVFQEKGVVELFGRDERNPQLNTAVARNFIPKTEEKLDNSSSWAFSRLLNDSLHDDSTTGPEKRSHLIIPRPSIESTDFVGDILGYVLYRHLLLQKGGFYALDNILASVPRIYGTIIGSFLQDSWPYANTSSEVKVTEMHWSETFRMSKVSLYILIATGAFFFTTIMYLLWTRQDFMFPLDPVPLGNAFYFLYQSSIIPSLEEIAHPERLSIDSLHRKVEAFGRRYVFGRYKASERHHEGFGVDRVEEFADGYNEQSNATDDFVRYTDHNGEDDGNNGTSNRAEGDRTDLNQATSKGKGSSDPESDKSHNGEDSGVAKMKRREPSFDDHSDEREERHARNEFVMHGALSGPIAEESLLSEEDAQEDSSAIPLLPLKRHARNALSSFATRAKASGMTFWRQTAASADFPSTHHPPAPGNDSSGEDGEARSHGAEVYRDEDSPILRQRHSAAGDLE